MIDFVGKEVKNGLGRVGKITRKLQDAFEITYSDKTVKTPFSAFGGGYIRAVDRSVQEEILLLCSPKSEEKKQMNTECKDKQESAVASQEHRSTFMGMGRRKVYFVFQGAEYFNELGQGYLWAAKKNKSGGEAPFHWRNLTKLREGDIVLHGVWQGIVHISMVTKEHYDWCRQDDLTREGWRVDCQGCMLTSPVVLADYREQIIELCALRSHQPFNKNGKGNQGYLYELNMPLARLFLDDILKNSPDVFDKLPGFRYSLKELGY